MRPAPCTCIGVAIVVAALLLAWPRGSAAIEPHDEPIWREVPSVFFQSLGLTITAPARWDHKSWLAATGIVGATLVMYQHDAAIDTRMQRNLDEWPLRNVIDVGETFDKLGLIGKTNRYYAGAWLTGHFLGWKKLETVGRDIFVSHLVTGIVRGGFVLAVNRRRPNEGMGSYAIFDGTLTDPATSFPSGHAVIIANLPPVLSHHFPYWWVRIPSYAIAGTVLVNRVASRQHWASDVFFAGVLGWSMGTLVANHNSEQNQRDGFSARLTPAWERRGVQISITW